MATNRETIRDAFVTLLSAALVGDGKPCQAVYGYRVADFDGQSPVVVVSSSGSDRRRMTGRGGGSRLTAHFQLDIFVLYAATGWTEANAEDRLDLIEATIAGVIDSNPTGTGFKSIDYNSRTERVDVMVGGNEYIREVMELRIEGYG